MSYSANNVDKNLSSIDKGDKTFRRYHNTRFNYVVKYPSFLSNITKSENGDGCIFSKDSNTFLKVYGMHNILNKTIEEEYNKYKSKSPVYSRQKGNWFVVSDYTDDGYIYYLKTVLRNDIFISAYIQYPLEEKELYSSIIAKTFNNFPN